MSNDQDILRSNFNLDYTYKRTTGPVVGKFFGGLKQKIILGIKNDEGKVFCPPAEFDPVTSKTLTDFVVLENTGIIQHYVWVHNPRDKHPLSEPFAWAFILIDGADSPMVHAVKANSQEDISIGSKVEAVWAEDDDRVGWIKDILYFQII